MEGAGCLRCGRGRIWTRRRRNRGRDRPRGDDRRLRSVGLFVSASSIWFDEEQRVIELYVRLSERESLERVGGLGIRCSEEVATDRPAADRLYKHIATLKPLQVEVTECVLP